MISMRRALAGFAAALACGAATWAVTPAAPPVASNDPAHIEQRYQQAIGRCAKVQGHGRELCEIKARGERQVQSAQQAEQGKRTPRE